MSLFWWAESVCALYTSTTSLCLLKKMSSFWDPSLRLVPFVSKLIWIIVASTDLHHMLAAPHNRMSECRQSGPMLDITKAQCCCFSSDQCIPEPVSIFWRTCLLFLLSKCHSFRHLHIQLYKCLKHFSVGLFWNRNISPFTWGGVSAFRRLL